MTEWTVMIFAPTLFLLGCVVVVGWLLLDIRQEPMTPEQWALWLSYERIQQAIELFTRQLGERLIPAFAAFSVTVQQATEAMMAFGAVGQQEESK